MSKGSKNQLRDVMKKAWSLFRKGILTFRQALKEAWRVVKLVRKAISTGVVTFWKISNDEVTTRRVAPLADFNYEPKGTNPSTDTYKFVDLDKLALTGSAEKSIISFNGFQIMETVIEPINALRISEEMQPSFEINDITVEGNAITVTTPSEYGELTLTVQVSESDDVDSVTDRLESELTLAYNEAEANDRFRADVRQDEQDMTHGSGWL